ncbi:MAG: YicC family protein [Acidobacteria bacterium]|nr:YicC family protein [Acidobacteriota bacterium]
MTGFGRGEAAGDGFRASVEARSVNHRFCEVKVRTPADLAGLEAEIRKRIQGRVRRGRVDVTVAVEREAEPDYRVEVDRTLVDRYLRAARLLQRDFRLAGEVNLESVLQLPGAVRVETERDELDDRESQVLYRALDRALEGLDRVRRAEGSHLRRDLRRRLGRIGRLAARIRRAAAGTPERLAARLRARIEAIVSAGAVDPDRIAQVAALLAERADVTEELVRLQGHLEQAAALLEGEEGEPGKRLDFLAQEMHREANTIGAKTADLGVTRAIVEIKAEIEKIREQVQNLE